MCPVLHLQYLHLVRRGWIVLDIDKPKTDCSLLYTLVSGYSPLSVLKCSVQSVSGSDGWVVSVTASAARQRSSGQRRHLQRLHQVQGQRGRHFAACSDCTVHTAASGILGMLDICFLDGSYTALSVLCLGYR